MDAFLLVGGFGSLAIAGFCYSSYKNIKDVATQLKNTPCLAIGEELFDNIKNAPNYTLDYIAIRGVIRSVESTLTSNNVPSAKLLIQSTSIYEHKTKWVSSTKLWQDSKTLLSNVVNYVPFSLNSTISSYRVVVDEPLSATGLDYSYTQLYNKYEPLNSSSITANVMHWVTGEKTKGIQTIEDGLLEGTALTAVGKVTLRQGLLKIKPPENQEYILSRLTLPGIIQEKASSIQKWKYVTIGFSAASGVLLLIWVYRRWRAHCERIRPRYIDANRDELNEDVVDQACVICLTNRRNVVILNCGHICVCRLCAYQIDSCPICRGDIQQLVPTFHS